MNTETWIGGEVIIDPSVAIAQGVLLQAEENCRVIIGAGTCIGMGVVIHAVGGDIVIGTGVNLGAGVLVYGSLQIGSNACIGSATSLINCSVPSGEIIIAGSLVCKKTKSQESATSDTSDVAQPFPQPQASPKEDDPLRAHARIHLQQFLRRIFIQ